MVRGIKENPNSSTFATILMILSILNESMVQYGSMLGFNDRYITIGSGVFLILVYIYNELKTRGIIQQEKSVFKQFRTWF